MSQVEETVTGLILAGGRGVRLGNSDKGLTPLLGRPAISWVIEALKPQVAGLLISANRHLDDYARLGWPVIRDQIPDNPGPLAGILAALAHCATPWLAVSPCDSPCPPPDLVRRLAEGATAAGSQIAVAHDGERPQWLHCLMHRSLEPDLRSYLAVGERAVRHWMTRQGAVEVDMSDAPGAFMNINDPGDVSRVEAYLRKHASPAGSI
ncbi:MAG: molybdenum cofactor guanylyltransferase MobA [Pseudomonadota bacterium]